MKNEQDQNGIVIAKKTWITPNVEIISTNNIERGGSAGAPEADFPNAPNQSHFAHS